MATAGHDRDRHGPHFTVHVRPPDPPTPPDPPDPNP
jgi:hypothetical protein